MLGKKEEDIPNITKPEQHNIQGYVDTTDSLSNKSLTWAEWLLHHKLFIRKWFIIILIIINTLLILYSLYGWGRYFLFDYTNLDQSLVNMSQSVVHYANLEPRPLQLRNTQVFSSGRNRYDFMVDVVNPNPNWRADVTYQFSYAGGSTEELIDTVYPGDNQILTAFGIDAPGFPINIQAQIKHISWKRIDPHVVPDPISFMQSRLDVGTDNVLFRPANQTEGVVTHEINFDLINNSVYGYWVPTFDAILINNQSPAGVIRFEVDGLRPNEKKPVTLYSLSPSLRVTDVQLIPRIDVFDQSEYIPPGE